MMVEAAPERRFELTEFSVVMLNNRRMDVRGEIIKRSMF